MLYVRISQFQFFLFVLKGAETNQHTDWGVKDPCMLTFVLAVLFALLTEMILKYMTPNHLTENGSLTNLKLPIFVTKLNWITKFIWSGYVVHFVQVFQTFPFSSFDS